MVRVTNRLDMTVVVDWDVKPQKKKKKKKKNLRGIERPQNANNRAFENTFKFY